MFATDDPAWRNRPRDQGFQLRWSSENAKRWAEFVSATRAYFDSREFQEARTPTLVPSPGTEPFLDPFRTTTVFGSRHRGMFLPTSPEFHLKKLLVGGFTRIYELKDCFRNDEGGGHHQPEFLMLEWYRAYANLEAIAVDVDDLIQTLASVLGAPLDAPVPPRLTHTTIRELFETYLDFDLRPETPKEALLDLAAAHAVPVDSSDGWDDVYFRIFLSCIEPEMAKSPNLWLVRDYPPSQAALARIGPSGWADRFEIYWRGLEIANAFHELNDPEANVARFEKDRRERVRLGKDPVPADEELIRALYEGMPPSGGIALGMDRLYMAMFGVERIENTRAFPYRA